MKLSKGFSVFFDLGPVPDFSLFLFRCDNDLKWMISKWLRENVVMSFENEESYVTSSAWSKSFEAFRDAHGYEV